MLQEEYAKVADQLDLYTQAICKAHGLHHPEVFEVRRIYEIIQGKMKDTAPQVREDFDALRQVTHDYAIPQDVCPTFMKTYQTLQQLDRLAFAETTA